MADSIHCVRKTLRLMPEEAKLLSEKAKACGMSEADYLRLLISQKPNDYPEIRKQLKALINEVNRIGININQIVFHHNAGLYSKEDKPITSNGVYRMMQKIADMTGVPLEKAHPHSLRHLFALTYIDTYNNIGELADILGHSSLEITRIYLSSSREEKRNKMNRLNL